jgi:hypothetical protein
VRLRPRLTLLTGLTLGAGLAVLCLAGNVLLSHTIDSDVHGRLTSRLDAIASSLSVTGGRIHVGNPITDAALDGYAWVYAANGSVIETPNNSRGPSLGSRWHEFDDSRAGRRAAWQSACDC